MKIKNTLTILLFALFLTACGGSDSDNTSPPPPSSGNPPPTPPPSDGGEDPPSDGGEDPPVDYTDPYISVGGIVGNTSLSLYMDEELSVPVQVVTYNSEYQLSVENSVGVSSAYNNSVLTISSNNESSLDIPEQIILTAVDDTGEVSESRIEIHFIKEGSEQTNEFFCFVGYCDERNPEPNEYRSVSGETYKAHFTAIAGTDLVFNYRLPSDFGVVQSVSFKVNGSTYDSGISVDQSRNEIVLNMRSVNSSNHTSITFTVVNVHGESESVTYDFRFRHVQGLGAIVVDVKDGQFPFMNYSQRTHSFELEIKEDILGGFRESEKEFNIVGFYTPNFLVEGMFNVEMDGNVLTLERREFYDDPEYLLSSSYSLYIVADCLSCKSGVDRFEGEFTFYYVDDQFISDLEYYMPLKDKNLMYSGSSFELDAAISFFETVFKMNGYELPYNKDVVSKQLRSVNNGIAQISSGFSNTFLEYKKNNVSLNSYINESRAIEMFNYTVLGILDSFDDVLNRYIGHVNEYNRDVRMESNGYVHGDILSGYRFKTDVLNSLISEFNKVKGSNYGLVSYSDLPYNPISFKDTYSYLLGNTAFGEYNDSGDFIFNEEYSYMVGINESLKSSLK